MRTNRTTLAIAALALWPASAWAAEGGGSPPLVDLPVVLTQVLGFVILLWALRSFAWGPLVAVLEERRARIAGEFAEAERRQAEADALRAKYEQELRGIEAQARQRLLEAVAEGQRVATEIRNEANARAVARMARAEEELVREQGKARQLLKRQVAALSVRTAEKILRERLDEATQRRMVERFLEEVDPTA
jgi:F-type H+-transporting ATPase subunit b